MGILGAIEKVICGVEWILSYLVWFLLIGVHPWQEIVIASLTLPLSLVENGLGLTTIGATEGGIACWPLEHLSSKYPKCLHRKQKSSTYHKQQVANIFPSSFSIHTLLGSLYSRSNSIHTRALLGYCKPEVASLIQSGTTMALYVALSPKVNKEQKKWDPNWSD